MKLLSLAAALVLGVASQAVAEQPAAYDPDASPAHVPHSYSLPPLPEPRPEAQPAAPGISVRDDRMVAYADRLLSALNQQNAELARISEQQTAILRQLMVNNAAQTQQAAQAQH
jgi:hypothetical protein